MVGTVREDAGRLASWFFADAWTGMLGVRRENQGEGVEVFFYFCWRKEVRGAKKGGKAESTDITFTQEF